RRLEGERRVASHAVAEHCVRAIDDNLLRVVEVREIELEGLSLPGEGERKLELLRAAFSERGTNLKADLVPFLEVRARGEDVKEELRSRHEPDARDPSVGRGRLDRRVLPETRLGSVDRDSLLRPLDERELRHGRDS